MSNLSNSRDKNPLDRRARRDLRVFRDGAESALETAVPALERKYRLFAALRFWVAIAVVSSISFAAGYFLG